MAEPALEVRNLVKRFGALTATDHLSFEVRPGELHAIIGPNGAGKTTLIAQLSGELPPTEGQVYLLGKDVTHLPVAVRAAMGIGRSFQITSLCPDFSALQNVALAVQAHQTNPFGMWARADEDNLVNDTARRFLSKVGLESRADVQAGFLAHGEQRQLEVAVALACQPQVLLLDEPMAGMGREESRTMTRLLQSLKGQYSILLVEHDMDAVFSLADRITVLVYGRAIATGTANEIAASAEVRSAYLGEGKSKC